jgi:hypothetical protein
MILDYKKFHNHYDSPLDDHFEPITNFESSHHYNQAFESFVSYKTQSTHDLPKHFCNEQTEFLQKLIEMKYIYYYYYYYYLHLQYIPFNCIPLGMSLSVCSEMPHRTRTKRNTTLVESKNRIIT